MGDAKLFSGRFPLMQSGGFHNFSRFCMGTFQFFSVRETHKSIFIFIQSVLWTLEGCGGEGEMQVDALKNQ